jgi:hypothetical protein
VLKNQNVEVKKVFQRNSELRQRNNKLFKIEPGEENIAIQPEKEKHKIQIYSNRRRQWAGKITS